ncbi:MAG: energy-coupling factor transporter transmembrane component T [Oscillospiraceae bacterium]|nr:energy-coupling factor transporter transmembrane component T [Oscillospiraceae bacterium]
MKHDAFSSFHPLVGFLYFLLVLLLSMFFFNPVCLVVSLFSAVTYAIYLGGTKTARFQLRVLLPLMLLTAVLNPVFNHEGATILTYLPNGNPLTLEAIAYGAAASVMLAAVVTWFFCLNQVMTSDKFIYLFGRIIPALSLLLSMTLRFVPRFSAQMKAVAAARRAACPAQEGRNLLQKAKQGLAVFSITVTWALENSIETADSMKCRGYGLSGRTAYSIYRLTPRDLVALAVLFAAGAYVVLGSALGGISFQYYPVLSGRLTGAYSISIFFCYLLLCLLPMLINVCEDLKWNSLTSAI